MKQLYIDKTFSLASLDLIARMNDVISDYVQQGYRLTVRQLYYQLVAGDVIENTERSYKRITGMVNDAKLAGLMDWDAIEDRTREFVSRPSWESRAQILDAVATQFHMDMWSSQPSRAFVIVEKEALAGVLGRACEKLDTPMLAARGYPSGTVLREFCQKMMIPAMRDGQDVAIFHFGDHDPSGIDMTRDLLERIALFCGSHDSWSLKRVALTFEQIDKYGPPPNPAKATDSRFIEYQRKHGDESWELDALKPEVLDDLVSAEVGAIIDDVEWRLRKDEIEANRKRLSEIAKHEGDASR